LSVCLTAREKAVIRSSEKENAMVWYTFSDDMLMSYIKQWGLGSYGTVLWVAHILYKFSLLSTQHVITSVIFLIHFAFALLKIDHIEHSEAELVQ
jgi:hypothetical protein